MGWVWSLLFQWCSDTFSDLMVGFVNSVKTIDGGTHIEGFKVRLLSAQPFHLHPVQCQHPQTRSRELGCIPGNLCTTTLPYLSP